MVGGWVYFAVSEMGAKGKKRSGGVRGPSEGWSAEKRAYRDELIAAGYRADHAAGVTALNFGKVMARFTTRRAEVLDRLMGGESVRDFAQREGVSPHYVYLWLRGNAPEEWRKIQAASALERVERAESDMDAAEDAVSVARARESARLGQWRLEAVSRLEYGREVGGPGGVVVNVVIDPSCGGSVVGVEMPPGLGGGEVLEGECSAEEGGV